MSLPEINEVHYHEFLERKKMGEWISPGLRKFVSDAGVEALSAYLAPEPLIDRKTLRTIAHCDSGHVDRDVLWTVLWWGGMDRRNAESLAKHEVQAEKLFRRLRREAMSRKEAYQAFLEFRKQCPRSGLGPAFFTKLIFFARPVPDGYIMDRFAARAINLLFPSEAGRLVKLNGRYVSDRNTAQDYENYCLAIEALRDRLNLDHPNDLHLTGEDVEKLLFAPSSGNTASAWRAYVTEHTR